MEAEDSVSNEADAVTAASAAFVMAWVDAEAAVDVRDSPSTTVLEDAVGNTFAGMPGINPALAARHTSAVGAVRLAAISIARRLSAVKPILLISKVFRLGPECLKALASPRSVTRSFFAKFMEQRECMDAFKIGTRHSSTDVSHKSQR